MFLVGGLGNLGTGGINMPLDIRVQHNGTALGISGGRLHGGKSGCGYVM